MHSNISNIKITCILAMLILTNVKCEKIPAENFPYASVSLNVNLLTTPIGVSTGIVCPNSNNTGALGKGILLYNVDGTSYLAYSRLCTNYPKDTAAVNFYGNTGQNLTSGNLVQCPKCKSIFYLTDGSVFSGPAKYPLKQYSVTVSADGNSLLIQN